MIFYFKFENFLKIELPRTQEEAKECEANNAFYY